MERNKLLRIAYVLNMRLDLKPKIGDRLNTDELEYAIRKCATLLLETDVLPDDVMGFLIELDALPVRVKTAYMRFLKTQKLHDSDDVVLPPIGSVQPSSNVVEALPTKQSDDVVQVPETVDVAAEVPETVGVENVSVETVETVETVSTGTSTDVDVVDTGIDTAVSVVDTTLTTEHTDEDDTTENIVDAGTENHTVSVTISDKGVHSTSNAPHIRYIGDLLAEGCYTLDQVAEKVVIQFPDKRLNTMKAYIRDAKNPKYNTMFIKAVVMDKETGVYSFAREE